MEREPARARKENVNQASGLGKDGKAPSHPRESERDRERKRERQRANEREKPGATVEQGDEVDRRPESRACMRLPFIRALDRVRAPVRRCKCNSRRGLVVSSPGDISPLLRTKLSLSPSLSLSFSFSCSLALSFSSSFPPVLQRAGKLDVFSSPGGRRCRVSAPESSIFFPFVLFAFLYVPLLGAGFRRGRSNVASVLVFTRIIHNA